MDYNLCPSLSTLLSCKYQSLRSSSTATYDDDVKLQHRCDFKIWQINDFELAILRMSHSSSNQMALHNLANKITLHSLTHQEELHNLVRVLYLGGIAEARK
ncbi:unnamed protein product [Camellia sinensis]